MEDPNGTVGHPFGEISSGQLESLNALQDELANDQCQAPINLMYGVYRTDAGEPLVFRSVREARARLNNDVTWHHEYPPSHLGTKTYRQASTELMFGADHPLVQSKLVVTAQALGASGACHAAALFLKLHYEPWKGQETPKVYIPAESWANHPNVFTFLGLQAISLPYYDHNLHSLAFEAFNSAIEALPRQSVIVLQSSSQNPTGCDPTTAQWQLLAETSHKRGHFAFFDAAYLGFVTGDVYLDTKSIRVFADTGVPLLVAATYGKTFGLYGERVGFLSIIAPSTEVATRIETQMKLIARAETGAMPAFGARLVEMILTDPELREMWEEELRCIADNLKKRRLGLSEALQTKGTPGDWDFLTEQVGMFSIMPFSDAQMRLLREIGHIYVQENGRLSVGALNSSNLEIVATHINKVMIL